MLQGDVGSGKTIISVIAAYINHLAKYQTALMAPTEVLAYQHYETIKTVLESTNIRVALLVGSMKKKEKEGVSFLFKHNITQIIGNEKVEKIECIKTELVQKEGETRKSPVEIEGSNYTIDMDYVVMALGSKTEINVVKNLGLELTQEKYVKINDKKQTSNEKVFAGGDLVGEKSTVAWAAKSTSAMQSAETMCPWRTTASLRQASSSAARRRQTEARLTILSARRRHRRTTTRKCR